MFTLQSLKLVDSLRQPSQREIIFTPPLSLAQLRRLQQRQQQQQQQYDTAAGQGVGVGGLTVTLARMSTRSNKSVQVGKMSKIW